MAYTWIRHDGALCLHGYAIRIVRGDSSVWKVVQDGVRTSNTESLAYSKFLGEDWAAEMDEFEGVDQ